jgi:kynureninase
MISELEKKLGLSAMDEDFCASIDKSYMDTGYFHGDEFVFPKMDSTDGVREKVVYLCGNSLGLQPKSLSIEVNAQLTKWGEQGVDGHFTDPTPWLTIDDIVQEDMATLVGALPKETVVMNSLTTNLHLMMASFYVPQGTRNKILIEKKAFPSDVHAVTSQILHHRLNPADCLLEIAPRGGETTLREEDVMEMIEKEGDNIALVLLSGVQYYTGQFFNIADITTRAHAKGCLVGWDLAHAVGNVPLQLHDWDVDFACWCTYKYMNCGPGSIGGCFVHENMVYLAVWMLVTPLTALACV